MLDTFASSFVSSVPILNRHWNHLYGWQQWHLSQRSFRQVTHACSCWNLKGHRVPVERTLTPTARTLNAWGKNGVLSWFYLHCPSLHLLSNRLQQLSPDWSSKGLPSSLQSALNPAARLIARLPRSLCPTSLHAFMFDHLHWLPSIDRIQLRVLTLYSRVCWSSPQVLIPDLLICVPSSPVSISPLRSLDRWRTRHGL